MKITVDRSTNQEGHLVFTIIAQEPNQIAFSDVDRNVMLMLSACRQEIETADMQQGLIKEDLLNLLHGVRDSMFQSVIRSLKKDIKGQLQPKIKRICQEIYNWMYDNQSDVVRKWLEEFDPQRVKYYFDNDRTAESDYDGE